MSAMFSYYKVNVPRSPGTHRSRHVNTLKLILYVQWHALLCSIYGNEILICI